MIATGSEASKVWALPHSHKYAYTTEDAESSLAMHLWLVLVGILSFSVFVGRGDHIHAGAGAEKNVFWAGSSLSCSSSAKTDVVPWRYNYKSIFQAINLLTAGRPDYRLLGAIDGISTACLEKTNQIKKQEKPER